VRTPILAPETIDYLVDEGFAVAEPTEIAASVAQSAAGEETGRA
jgi:hypothetical protein